MKDPTSVNVRPRRLSKLFGLTNHDFALVAIPIVAVVLAAIWMTFKLVRPAPPDRIRLLGGAEGSSYRTTAERYKAIIERHGVKVEIIPSKGALDNLQRLANRAEQVDVGLVQGGLIEPERPASSARPSPAGTPPTPGTPSPTGTPPAAGTPAPTGAPSPTAPAAAGGPAANAAPRAPALDTSHLMSLGSMFEQPMMVYYRRGTEPVELLTQLKGKRLAIGPEGSGTRALALRLLKANDMDRPPQVLLDLGGEAAVNALIQGTIDAAFLMGDSVTFRVQRRLRDVPEIALMSFRQADGYVRRLHFLQRIMLPEGAMDLGKNYPPQTVSLVGTTIELIARDDLHPALSDLLISAAREVHSRPGLYREAGEYPAPVARDFPLSPDAERYYKSGAQFLYKRLPFWLASLVDRLIVLILPLLVLIVPVTRTAPALYRWRIRSRIYRWYGALLSIERDMMLSDSPDQRQAIRKRLELVEHAVTTIKLPLSFADQLYVLRNHVASVRHRLDGET